MGGCEGSSNKMTDSVARQCFRGSRCAEKSQQHEEPQNQHHQQRVNMASAHGSGGWITCTLCHQPKPTSDYSRNQLARHSREVCGECLRSQGAIAAPPSRVAPAAGEGYVRCVACCQLKATSAFGINQLRRRAGIERCMLCVESDHGSMVLCNACHTLKPFTEFSKKQLACKPGSERCKVCIERSLR